MTANKDFICVETYSGYYMYYSDPLAELHLLKPDAGDREIGTAVLDALARSRFVHPYEDPVYRESNRLKDIEKILEPRKRDLMSRYGYKTESALYRKMKRVSIAACAGTIEVQPMRRYPGPGWEVDAIRKDYVRYLPADSAPEALGQAVRFALSRCL